MAVLATMQELLDIDRCARQSEREKILTKFRELALELSRKSKTCGDYDCSLVWTAAAASVGRVCDEAEASALGSATVVTPAADLPPLVQEKDGMVFLGPQVRNKKLILPTDGGPRSYWVEAGVRGISLGFTGCGTCESESDPVYLDFEYRDQPPVLYVWGDINQPEPTVKVDLRHAMEVARRPIEGE